MTLIAVIVFLIIIGVVLYILRSRMSKTILDIIIVLVVLAVVMWLLNAFNLVTLPAALRLGK